MHLVIFTGKNLSHNGQNNGPMQNFSMEMTSTPELIHQTLSKSLTSNFYFSKLSSEHKWTVINYI